MKPLMLTETFRPAIEASVSRIRTPRSVGSTTHPEVEALREKLREHNGIRGLEICEPHETQKIARIFHRDGFAVVKDLLNAEQLARWRSGCAEALRDILSIPGPENRKYTTETGRLPHRYSYGTSSASRQMLHHPAWASMIDLQTTTPIVTEIFGSSDYRVWGSGGDLCLPGAVEYQHLHPDGRDPQHLSEARIKQAELVGAQLHRDNKGNLDVPSQKMIMEMTPPTVTINFVMCDLTWETGRSVKFQGHIHCNKIHRLRVMNPIG